MQGCGNDYIYINLIDQNVKKLDELAIEMSKRHFCVGADGIITIDKSKSDTYYLEWKWDGENDDNDTQIGKNAKSSNITYNLKISVEAESV